MVKVSILFFEDEGLNIIGKPKEGIEFDRLYRMEFYIINIYTF